MTLQADIISLFAARGAAQVDVPLLQPADPFLDIAGEDLRRRIFLTESDRGESLCLRPEFTIPVCRDHIANRAATPRRYAYLGEVFRQRREGSNQFIQAGLEDLGDTDAARADARSISDAQALLAMALPGARFRTSIGDKSVFEAVLASLGLPRGWQKRLARAFGSQALIDAALADLASPPVNRSLSGDLNLIAASGDRAALAGFIESEMSEAGISPTSGRTPDEIARRLLEKYELQNLHLPAEAMNALRSFLGIHVPLDQAVGVLRDFAAGAGNGLGAGLEAFAARVEAMKAQGIDIAAISYDAAFGRPLDYYTGLVFEIALDGAAQPLVGGGRYDRLLTLLGAEAPIPGVGFSIWVDRIEEARRASR
ncbi:MAG: ATP phosphoribosyltransferase regulatory subunit [Mesorhizobium sp.]